MKIVYYYCMKKIILFLIVLTIIFSGCLDILDPSGDGDGGNETSLSAPVNLKATPKTNSIELNWEPIKNKSLKGYNIYRSLNQGKDYGKINSYPITESTYRDNDLTGGLTYYYVITAVSVSDKESNYSTEVNSIPIIINDGPKNKPYTELCEKELTQLKTDQCLNDYAIQYNDISACREIQELSIDNCVKEIAVNLKNYDSCKEIKLKNITLRDDCFYDIAVSLKDSGGCSQIIDSTKSNTCNAIVAASENSIEACRKISVVSDRDLCFEAIGVSTKDFVVCSYISTAKTGTGFKRDACLDTVLTEIKEETMCGYYLGTDSKNNCYSEVGKDKKNPLICNKSTDQNISDHCIKSIAVEEQDSDYCLQIIQSEVFQECVIEVGEANPNKDACELIENLATKDNCFYNTAKSTQKDLYCSYVLDNEIRDTCYDELAVELNNEDLCSKIRLLNSNLKNHCYSNIAINSLNSSLCENLTGSTQYIDCYNNIAVSLTDYSLCNSADKYFPKLIYATSDYCFYAYAEDTNNANACAEIRNIGYRTNCDTNALG